MIKVGLKVSVPWWDISTDGSKPALKVADLIGTIERIDGAYHYVKVENNPKYDVIELFETEFKVIK